MLGHRVRDCAAVIWRRGRSRASAGMRTEEVGIVGEQTTSYLANAEEWKVASLLPSLLERGARRTVLIYSVAAAKTVCRIVFSDSAFDRKLVTGKACRVRIEATNMEASA